MKTFRQNLHIWLEEQKNLSNNDEVKEMLENVQAYTKDMPEFELRLRVKAGLTGYAQIFGKYNTSPKDKLILDLMYIENYSISS